MTDCWHKEPEARLDFGAISKRLKNPFGNYDVPPPRTEASTDVRDGEVAGENFGAYRPF